jgi:uncharacterized protein YecT (DUF1311 family)
MRILTLAGLCIFQILSAPLQALAESTDSISNEYDVRVACSEEFFTQIAVHACVVKKYEASEKTLKLAESIVLEALSRWDEDEEYINTAKETLLASKDAFIKSRKAQCDFAASINGGGAGHGYEMRRLACVTELNNRRAKQLRDLVANLPLKEPQPPQ